MRITAIVGLSLACCAWAAPAQGGPTNTAASGGKALATIPIPKFLVYRHFLGWVNELNNRAVSSGATDPHKFADPFQRAGLAPQDLDAILTEAKSLDSDLSAHSEKLKVAVAAYRRTAQTSTTTPQNGGVLPPAPRAPRQPSPR